MELFYADFIPSWAISHTVLHEREAQHLTLRGSSGSHKAKRNTYRVRCAADDMEDQQGRQKPCWREQRGGRDCFVQGLKIGARNIICKLYLLL